MVAMLTMTAGRARAQPTSEEDPTPINVYSCNGLYTPPWVVPYPGANSGCYPPAHDPELGPFALDWNVNTLSWIEPDQTMGATNSPRDRRPAFFLQCWNGSWTDNPNGLVDWWVNWRQNPQTGVWEDAPRDDKTLNPTTLLWTTASNGVPDQFEELYFRYQTMYLKGIRRFILKLPGGSPFGKPRTVRIGTTDHTIYEGQNMPMNQWGMLPKWKKEWFLGHKINPDGSSAGPLERLDQPGTPPPWQPWQDFITEGCGSCPNLDPADRKKIEIYVGFNIQSGICTPCEDHNPIASGTFHKNSPVDGYPTGVNQNGEFLFDPYWFTGCNSETLARDPDPRKQVHMDHIYHSLTPWHGAGVTRIWCDTGSDNTSPMDAPNRAKRFGFLNIAHCPQMMGSWGNQQSPFIGLSFGGEAIPIATDTPTDRSMDDCALTYAPWCALSPMFTTWTHGNGGPFGTGRDFFPSMKVDPDLTEVHMLVNPWRRDETTGIQEPELTFHEFGAFRERGFVISVYNFYNNNGSDAAYYERLLNRWYSMGKILIPDFNGDGVVSPTISGTDYQMAYAATHPSQQPERFVFATGNIVNITPNERVVDIEDWLAWEKAWKKYVEEGVHSGPLVEMDYGFAKTIDCR